MKQETSGLHVDLEDKHLQWHCKPFGPNKPSLASELSSQREKCTTLVI